VEGGPDRGPRRSRVRRLSLGAALRPRSARSAAGGARRLALAAILALLCLPSAASAALSCPRNVWAFYPYYWHSSGFTASTILYDHLTAVVHFDINPNADGSLAVPGGLLEPALIADAHAAGDKVLIDCGGSDSGASYSVMASSPAAMTAFVNNVYTFMATNGYDGLDVDWEFPGSAADTANLNTLVQKLRAKFNASPAPAPSWIISVELPSGWYFGQWFDVATLAASVDYEDIELYGLYGSWDSHSGHNAPLFLSTLAPPSDGGLDGYDAIQYFEGRGVPASKLQYGMACYGESYASSPTIFASCGGACSTSTVFYSQIPGLIAGGATYHFDASADSPYLTQPGVGVVSYDDANSTAIKANYVLWTQNLAGVFCWDIYQDWLGGAGPSQQPILNAMWLAAQCATSTPSPSPSASPTSTRSPSFTVSPTVSPSPTITPTFTISPTFSVSPTLTPSATISPTVTPGQAAGEQPRVYPNPFHPLNGQTAYFDRVEAGSTIAIFSITGKEVLSYQARGVPALDAWGGVNVNGHVVTTGLYLVVISQPSGRKDILRVAVVR